MRERGFNAYALPRDDYEISRCHDAPELSVQGVGVPPRPRRLCEHEVARVDGDGAQLDVIFSRTDAEFL
jgi:hypothetical protein